MGVKLQLSIPRLEAMKSEQDKSAEALSKLSRRAQTYTRKLAMLRGALNPMKI